MPDCKACKENRTGVAPVPYIAHESAMARMERTNRRSQILNIILAVLLAISWLGFLIYESQFEFVEETYTQEVTQDTERGDNQFVGGDYYYPLRQQRRGLIGDEKRPLVRLSEKRSREKIY